MKPMKTNIFEHILAPVSGIEAAYPLPPARSDMCRDAFLRELLLDYESSKQSQTSLETLYSIRRPVKQLKFDEIVGSYNTTEDLLLRDFLSGMGKMRSQSFSKSITSSRGSRTGTDILRIMHERKWNIMTAIGFIGVLLQLTELKNRLRVLRELWKVDVNLDKSFRMFSWSHNDYYNRFGMRDTTYLDITERELGDQMECYKFNIDIHEISRLVDAIDDDIRRKRDICDNSMLMINEAKLDIANVLTQTKKEAEKAHAETVLEVCRMPRSADPDRSIRYEANKNFEYNDFIYPIEARYLINWTETQAEQHKMWNDRGYNKMVEEITHLQTTTIESTFIWQSSGTAYEMQIAGLRRRIFNLEEEYEIRISLVDTEKKVLQNKLQQAIEDLKKCMDSIPYFHERIAEVNAILYPPVPEEPEPEPEPVKTKKKGKGKH